MFETLTERLSSAFSFLRGKKELSEENIDEGLRQVRQALLEADVNYKGVGDCVERVRARV
ncbi:MAG: signal recognition particle receptor subunit alpha, partial [bacterium]